MKTISFRASDEDLEKLEDLKNYLEKEWKKIGYHKKVTMSDVIFQAILSDWQSKFLPFN